jgi:CheY-like chemotaxis protein/HPt (histidine-containing phosphotransfer) domain-containing protein
VVFEVRDNGVGIPESEQRNLFIRFSRLKSARNSAVPGTGLGLAVCRALAERMGGAVGVESALGVGSTFFLRLEMRRSAKTELSCGCFHADGARALVVEDIEYNARALGMMLTKLGFSVEFAADGREGLAKLVSVSYQAVFLDCNLPGLSGADVARSFRAIETDGVRARIIATTALSTTEDMKACLAAGMDGFITKPITPEKLQASLAGRAPMPRATGSGDEREANLTLDLGVIRHLADRTPDGMGRELARFTASMDESIAGFESAAHSGSREAIASEAHRVLAHARMVGATALAAICADLQEFAAAYSKSELAQEIGKLRGRAAEVRQALTRAGGSAAPR